MPGAAFGCLRQSDVTVSKIINFRQTCRLAYPAGEIVKVQPYSEACTAATTLGYQIRVNTF